MRALTGPAQSIIMIDIMTSEAASILTFQAPVGEVQKRVRAAAGGDVWIDDRVLAELDQKQISDIEIVRVLKAGVVEGEAKPGDGEGAWICEIVELDRHRRQRELVSVTVELRSGELWILKIRWVKL